jgi:hypothetical protein
MKAIVCRAKYSSYMATLIISYGLQQSIRQSGRCAASERGRIEHRLVLKLAHISLLLLLLLDRN